MEFLIFSDSHGRYGAMRAAYQKQVRHPDGVMFLGDGLRDLEASDFPASTLYAVQGNCDWTPRMTDGAEVTDELILSFEGHRLLLAHGHRYHVKSGYGGILAYAARMDVDVVLFGHTHTPTLEIIPSGSEIGGVELSRPIYLFNPGSIGQSGSFGTLSLRGENVLLSHGRV